MDIDQPLKILILSSEVAPFAGTGKLADVVGQLPKALEQLGHDVRVAMPRYARIHPDLMQRVVEPFPVASNHASEAATVFEGRIELDVPIYFIDNPRLFDREALYMYADDAERFLFFCRAAIEMLRRLDWQPDIIHCNDWQTAIVPNWLKTIYASDKFFERTATVYTIHNLAAQGIFDARVLELAGLTRFGFISHPEVSTEINEAFDFMARGILFADGITTISETYARMIQTPEYGEKLDPILRMRARRLRGILNGVDYSDLNPATDPALAQHFDMDRLDARATNKTALQQQLGLAIEPQTPILAMIGPLNDAAGLDVVADTIDHILDLNVQFVLMGSGDQHYHKIFGEWHAKRPLQFAVSFTQDEALLRKILAGSDALLMPARLEPDGTTQLMALRYGCVPVVRASGALADSITNWDPRLRTGNGITFDQLDRWTLFAGIVRALETLQRPQEWRALQRQGMIGDFSWQQAAGKYVELYQFALGKKLAVVEREATLAREIDRTAEIMANLPEAIRPLRDLVYNLWWSWNDDALCLFERIDPANWESTNRNPVKLLRQVSPERLNELATDADFLQHYQRVMTALNDYMHPSGTWFESTYPYAGDRMVAYFSAEFGLHESLPIYSGGLGILSGDHTKESSELGLPLIAVGFLYPQGYFHQEVDRDGNQLAVYDKLNFAEVPAVPARDADGKDVMIQVELPGRAVHAKVWQIQVGRVSLYLMDTDVEANAEQDRELSARLYGGDHEMRIMQEIVLGIGGIRVLRALGLYPNGFHMNEGHSTFLVLELIRELVAQGYKFQEALHQVSARCVFTTHTPVKAGNDAFSHELMDKYFGGYYPQLGISREDFLNLANQDGQFSMTVLGLRGSNQRNAVSKLHGQISREMWQFVWSNLPVDQVPISYITNGVHTATWLAPELAELFEQCLGKNWYGELDRPALWQNLKDVEEKWWQIHVALKSKLLDFVRTRAVERSERNQIGSDQIQAARSLLDPSALTIGFARRFATYKRATLMFRDQERLKRILNGEGRPVQVIFSGKAHPADEPGKDLIRAVLHYSGQPGLEGRIVFLENYGIDDARALVRGVDVWLNNPRRPLEASGTSGQKSGLNGGLNLSILDGWWIEGFDGSNGWAIGQATRAYDSTEAQDESDALSLYNVLENEVVPLYYQRDENGVPRQWIAKSLDAIRKIAPEFSTRRMLKQYVQFYLKAMMSESEMVEANVSAAR